MKSRIVTIVAGLSCVLAVQVGVTTAAAAKSGASATGALPGNVRIHLRGSLSGGQVAPGGRGRFTLTGAIFDRGRFIDTDFRGVHPDVDWHVRTLFGAKGTLRINVTRTRQWRITKGTKAYARLRGHGTEQGQYRFVGIDVTMTGTVSR